MDRLEIEKSILESGYEKIAGCDEAGRGCLFGSVAAAAVILPKGMEIAGVKDSKKINPGKREALYEVIMKNALAVGIGIVSADIIDRINIKNAAKLAMKKSIMELKNHRGERVVPDYILSDAEEIDLKIPQKAVIKGDDLCHCIGAASIIAKVSRDRMCLEWHQQFPHYKIDKHKGYGTKIHKEAIIKYGPCELHRKTFLKKILL